MFQKQLNYWGVSISRVHDEPIDKNPHSNKEHAKKEFVEIFFQIFFNEKVETNPSNE